MQLLRGIFDKERGPTGVRSRPLQKIRETFDKKGR